MNDFHYKGNDLFCEDVPVREIADTVGTPLYLYSRRTIINHFRAFDAAFSGIPHVVCYSVKANSNLAVLKTLFSQGSGADVVSGGELYRALRAGVDPKKVVFSGVGKTAAEMEMALAAGIMMFNVESSQELRELDAVAGKMCTHAPVALRINPDIDPRTHPYIATGLKGNKFGIPADVSVKEYRAARGLKNIGVVGIDSHIGSQITDLSPFVSALRTMKRILSGLRREGFLISYLDIGGGLGIAYNHESLPQPKDYAEALVRELGDEDVTLVLEPGRVLMGNAGILVSRVLYTKKAGKKTFVIIDAGMNDLLRPGLYNAFQEVVPVKKSRRRVITADVVGPICETTDFMARGRKIPEMKPGELVAVLSAGAYGFSMSSNYNSRPRAAEAMVKGRTHVLIRRRESYEDLTHGERDREGEWA